MGLWTWRSILIFSQNDHILAEFKVLSRPNGIFIRSTHLDRQWACRTAPSIYTLTARTSHPDVVMFTEIFITSNADEWSSGNLGYCAIVLTQFCCSLVSLWKDFSPKYRGVERKRKINEKVTEKYHLKDIAWALNREGLKTKKPQHKFLRSSAESEQRFLSAPPPIWRVGSITGRTIFYST
jgi:hypothetical protein